ncbi:MAG: zinc-binding dehydrogenase [Desulfurococcaceae archaeon]
MGSTQVVKEYRAAVFYEYKQPFRIEVVRAPKISGEEVLVKTAGCGLCHSDLHIWLGELPGIPKVKPCVLGHEPSGIVVDRGDAVPDYIKIGLPVLVQGAYYVEEDIYTLRGENVLATKASPMWDGSLGLHGGCYSEYFLVPSYRYLVPAEGLEDLVAASSLTDAGLTPYRAVKKAVEATRHFTEPDDFVVVVGVGGLGTFGAQYVNVLTPHLNLVVVDVKEEALEFAHKVVPKIHTSINAKKENPVEAVRKATGGRKVVAVVDFVGAETTVSTYVNVLAPNGAYVLVGLGGIKGSFSIPDLVLREWIIMGSYWGSVADLREVVQLAKKNLIKYKEMVTKRWKLDEINEALETMHRGKYVGRMVIAP